MSVASWSCAVVVETPRLVLHRWSIADAPDFLDLTSDSGFRTFSISNYRVSDMGGASAWIRARMSDYERLGHAVWPVRHKPNGDLLGICGLRELQGEEGRVNLELMYRLRRTAWGFGFATEAAEYTLRHAAQALGVKQVVAMVHQDNKASRRVLLKVGFRFVRRCVFRDTPVELFEAIHD
jgi:RimJ/RimL family protein N-acetyltransferase